MEENKGNTKNNNSGAFNIICTALVIAVIAMCAVIAALSDRSRAEAAGAGELDPEAMRVLSCCDAYLHGNEFRAELNGEVKARVFGVPYAQKISGERRVTNEEYSESVQTSSAFLTAALKKRVTDGAYYYIKGKHKRGRMVYSDESEISPEEFVASFGKPTTGLTRYELDGAVVCAKRLDGNVFYYELDPSRAASVYKNAVRTAAGAKKFPEFTFISFTLTVDGGRPTRVEATERFSVDRLGGTDCNATMVEKFFY